MQCQILNIKTNCLITDWLMKDEFVPLTFAEMANVSSEDVSEETPVMKRIKHGGRFAHPFYGRMGMHPSWPGHGMHFKKMKKMKKEAKRMKKAWEKRAYIDKVFDKEVSV